MPIALESANNIQIVVLRGQLNSSNAAVTESELLNLVGNGHKNLILDFSDLDYISSAGLRMVLVVAKKLKQEKGQLVLCGMQPKIHEVFDISGFLSILNVTATRNEALVRF